MTKKKMYTIVFALLTTAFVTAACFGGTEEPIEESELVEGSAEEIEEEEVVAEEESSTPELVGTTWQWIRFDDMGEINNLDVEDPTSYTLLLDADGRYHLKADCNMVSGDYTLDGSSLSFAPGLTTLAECGPDSYYDRYLTHISNVATYVMEDGILYLNLWADGGNMVFVPVE
ncbi:MAG: META domain-containing protein [Anaerolineae bacterium]|jgi:heat shock protein HslJ|nr:META domain-containing protein [Anaerolineae bacterium]